MKKDERVRTLWHLKIFTFKSKGGNLKVLNPKSLFSRFDSDQHQNLKYFLYVTELVNLVYMYKKTFFLRMHKLK